MKILNFGSCNIDYVYKVLHFVNPGETISSEQLTRFPGGKGLNQSIALARSGIQVYHAGCIGSDGIFLAETLKDSGINVGHIRVVDQPTGHAIIQVDNKGENSIILYGGANQMITNNFVDEVLSDFGEDDILILQNEINNTDLIIDKAYSKKMTIMLNPAPFKKNIFDIDLKKVSYLVLNETEAFEFSGENDVCKIGKFFKRNFGKLKIILTLGAEGSIYFDNEKDLKIECQAFNVMAKDTKAAGDTFIGYFACGLMKNMNIKDILEFSSAASALTVSKEGASSSIPTLSEVEEFIRKMNA